MQEGRFGAANDGDGHPCPGGEVFGRSLKAEDLLSGYISYLLDECGHSPRTARGYTDAGLCLSRWAGKPWHQISSDDLRRFKREPFKPDGDRYALATIQKVVVATRSFHKWGALEGHWQLNGIMGVVTPKTPFVPRPPLALHTAQIDPRCVQHRP